MTTRVLDGGSVTGAVPYDHYLYSAISPIQPITPTLPAIGQKPAVVLFVPSLGTGSFFGGAATAVIVAGRLAELLNRPLRIVQTVHIGKVTGLEAYLATEGVTLPATSEVVNAADRSKDGQLALHPDDIHIASAWWDAHLLEGMPLQRKFVYLIQDFEPIFYNNGDTYLWAEGTYKSSGYVPLCNTHLVRDFMAAQGYPPFGDSTLSFEPGVSRADSGLVVRKQPSERRKLFLYGRASVSRNLLFTALGAIDRCFADGRLDPAAWEVVTAGEDDVPDVRLPSGVVVKNLGKLGTDEYVALSKSIDVAVSPMMAPHPNYPTLEFASIGTAVVTTRWANKVDLSHYSPNIVMCDLDQESMANAICEAASLTYDERIANLTNNHIPDQWLETLDPVLKELIECL